MECNVIVLFDGWSIVYQPNCPAAVHLQTLLDLLPESVQPVVALPGEAYQRLPASVQTILTVTENTSRGRLQWEQRSLEHLARKAAAQVIHLFDSSPALFGKLPSVVSPAGSRLPDPFVDEPNFYKPPPVQRGLAARLRQALLLGGLSRISRVLWPADLLEAPADFPVVNLPMTVPQAFWQPGVLPTDWPAPELPERYVLCHGVFDEFDLRLLLNAWSWAAETIGEETPLVILGLDRDASESLSSLLSEYSLENSVLALPELPLGTLAMVYGNSSAVFHLSPSSPWGDPLCLALAAGKPVVALESRFSDWRLGSAAYLVRPADSPAATGRALGAALVTVIVEDSVAEPLAKAARQRSQEWQSDRTRFVRSLGLLYAELAG